MKINQSRIMHIKVMIHNGSIVDPHDIDIIETSYTDSYWNLYFEFY